MSTIGSRRRIDLAHHHPRVRKERQSWVWDCDCGCASCRTVHVPLGWREALIEALRHSTTIAA